MAFWWPGFGLDDRFWKNCVSILAVVWSLLRRERQDRILVQVVAGRLVGNWGLEPNRISIPSVWGETPRTELASDSGQGWNSLCQLKAPFLSSSRPWTLESTCAVPQPVLGSGNKSWHCIALYWKLTRRGLGFYCFTSRRRGEKLTCKSGGWKLRMRKICLLKVTLFSLSFIRCLWRGK